MMSRSDWWDDPDRLAGHHAAVSAWRRDVWARTFEAARKPMSVDVEAAEVADRVAAHREALGSSYAPLPEHKLLHDVALSCHLVLTEGSDWCL